jgi:hypothetical protein
VQRLCVVPDHLEPAAPRRPLWSESAYDDMTAAFHRANYLTDICPSIGCGGEEVKNRAIMPHSERRPVFRPAGGWEVQLY